MRAAASPTIERPPRANERPPYIGRSLPRLEDRRLVLGEGCYTDDNAVPGALFAAFVRSPFAHARIRSIDPSAALRRPGVVTVLTGADCSITSRFRTTTFSSVNARFGRPPDTW